MPILNQNSFKILIVIFKIPIVAKKILINLISNHLGENDVIILYFYYKFGSDGSTGYRQTKQNPSGDSTVVIDDNRLFVTTMVPIQIRVHDESDDNDNPEIIYHNLLCNSPQTCRPCRLCYERETAGKSILLG
jgi:hypothetical protein